ncbi:MAG: GTPase [Chloroflexia bacterium]
MATKPIVAIVGRPNVGKSTLFNRLIGERTAIVQNEPGTTRDRIYGEAEWIGRIFTVVDTGGLDVDTPPNGQSGETLASMVRSQAELAIAEADLIVFMLDNTTGVTPADYDIADILRRTAPVVLAANKADTVDRRNAAVDFYSLGMASRYPCLRITARARAICLTA